MVGCGMSMGDALDVAAIAATRWIGGPTDSELEDTIRLMVEFHRLSDGDKTKVVAILSGWLAAALTALADNPEDHLQELILEYHHRLGIDA